MILVTRSRLLLQSSSVDALVCSAIEIGGLGYQVAAV